MTFEIELTSGAKRTLTKLDPGTRHRIAKAIDGLASNPRPSGAKRIVDTPQMRIRIGDWRVLYLIEDARLLVLVVRIDHRSKAYRH